MLRFFRLVRFFLPSLFFSSGLTMKNLFRIAFAVLLVTFTFFAVMPERAASQSSGFAPQSEDPQPQPVPMAGAWQSHTVGGRNYFGFEAGLNYAWLGGAQNWFVNGGVNSPTLVAAITMPFADAGHGFGYILGLVGDYALSEHAAFEAKLRYLNASSSADDSRTFAAKDFSGSNQTLLAKVSSHYKASWSYAGLDLLLRYQLSPQSVYVLGGFGVSSLLSNTFEGSQSIDSPNNIFYIDQQTGSPSNFRSVSFPSQSLSSTYAGSRLDLKLGLGTFIPIGTGGTMLTPEVLFSIPFSDLFDAANLSAYTAAGAVAPKLWHLDFTVGIKFPWGSGAAGSSSSAGSGGNTNSDNGGDRNSDNMVVLKGKVKDKNGSPVDANMTVVDLSNNEIVSTGKSSDGDYELPVKGPGKYSVTADADGYLFGTSYFEVDDEGRILKGKHDITLSPSSDGRTRLLVFFDFNSDKLQNASYPELDRAVRLMKANPGMSVEIAGYTDSKGTDSYNIDLSNRRAQAVRNYLVRNGVETARVAPKGYGKQDPIATNDTEDGRAENRRVEFVVMHR
jgi:outer membrane protein OmpA-like peptidoglycan-associated protein